MIKLPLHVILKPSKEIALVSPSVYLPGDLVTNINYGNGNIWVKDTVIRSVRNGMYIDHTE
jgi:hypothetical protein